MKVTGSLCDRVMVMVPRTLSEALDTTPGSSSTTATDDGSRLVVIRHGADWLVGFRLIRVPGSAGVWQMTEMAARYLGPGASSVADLRALPLGELLAEARRLAGPDEDPSPRRRLTSLDESYLRPFLTEREHGKARPDKDYAQLAWVYVGLLERGITTPAAYLAEKHGHGSAAVWANRLSAARSRGLLTRVNRTTAGGELTDRAMEVLGYDQVDDEETDRQIAETQGRNDT